MRRESLTPSERAMRARMAAYMLHARYDPRRVVHEVPLLDGPIGYLIEPLIHFNYRTLAEFISKQERYARLEPFAAKQAGHHHAVSAVISTPTQNGDAVLLDGGEALE